MSVDIEERLAHLERLAEELSSVVAAQGGEIDALKQQIALLMGREAEREAAVGGGGVILGDERPPHY